MKTKGAWPKEPFYWRENNGWSYCSIPFTWNIDGVKNRIKRSGGSWMVGGPACSLLPSAFDDMLNQVVVHDSCPGVLQRLNPYAKIGRAHV